MATPYPTAQSLYDGPDVMFTPSSGYVRYIPPAVVRLPVVYPVSGCPGTAVPEIAIWNGWVYGYSCGLNSYGNPWC